MGSKKYGGGLTIRKLLPLVPHRSTVKGHKVVGHKAKAVAASGGPQTETKVSSETVETKRKKKIFTSRVLRSGRSQLVETDSEPAKATKSKSQTKEEEGPEPEASGSGMETPEKQPKRKSSCPDSTPSKKKKSSSETSDKSTPKSVDGNTSSKAKKRMVFNHPV